MNGNERPAPFSDALLDQAGAWFALMDNEPERHRGEFEKWCQESPDHQKAYDWVKANEAVGRDVPSSALLQARIEELDTLPDPLASVPLRKTWLWAGAAIAAGILLALGIRSLPLQDSPTTGQEVVEANRSYTAQHGEIRRVRLIDGSTVTLDTGSQVEVAMSATERKVRLSRGHVRFEVVSDPRPFRVEAGAGIVTAASQAVFDVGFGDDRGVLVQLVSGKADVRPALRSAVLIVPARSMVAGQNYAYTSDEAQPAPIPQEALFVDRSQWPTGWVDVHSITLEALIAEANRYAAQPIILDDPELAELAATGRFKVIDTDSFVRKISDLFQLKVDRRTDGIHLHAK